MVEKVFQIIISGKTYCCKNLLGYNIFVNTKKTKMLKWFWHLIKYFLLGLQIVLLATDEG